MTVRYGAYPLLRFLKKSQWWSSENLFEYQGEKLNALIKHAYENVPHYRKKFDNAGVKPSSGL